MKITLTFVTSNPEKANQLARHLAVPVKHAYLDIPEIQSLDLTAIIKHKARHAYDQLRTPVLVEDMSLTFTALRALPGPLIKWFIHPTSLGNRGICRLFNSFPDRSAQAEVCFGLYNGAKVLVFRGHMKGTIAMQPRGKRGFGWDPIFIPKGARKTWGQMTIAEQDATSMRRIALQKLATYLKKHS